MTWQNLSQQQLDDAYDQAVHAPNMQEVLARLVEGSEQARHSLGEPVRYAYGDAEVEGIDVYACDRHNSPVLIFIHGGSWRVGSAADSAFAATLFNSAGINFVVPDFSPVDDFGGELEGMLAQLQKAISVVYRSAADFGGNPQQIYLAGFSSGAHLAGVLLSTDWETLGLPADIFKGTLLCSGMYDLMPVSKSARREYLNLSDANIPALSPQMNIDKIMSPVLLAWGTAESPEFQRQAKEFLQHLAVSGKPVKALVGEGLNHFEIIETLGQADGLLGSEMLDMIGSN